MSETRTTIDGEATRVTDDAALPILLVNLQIARPEQLINMDFVAEATETVVDCDEMASIANENMRNVKGARNALEAQRKEMVKPIDEARAAVQSYYTPFIGHLEEAEGIYKRSLLGWIDVKRRRAEEEQRKAREDAEAAARRQAEVDAANQARIDKEAAELRQRAQAEAAAGNTIQAAKLDARAEQKVIAGEQAAQEAAIARAATTAVVARPPMATKLKGTGVRDNWKGRVQPEKKAQVLAFIAANPQYLHLVDFNDSALNQLAKALKENLPATIPGVEVWNDQSITTRGTRAD